MFKLLFIYPLVLFVLFWVTSDVEVGASLYSFDDNYISIEFPKEKFRSEDNPQPWIQYYWNAESARNELNEIKEAVVE